MLNWSMSLRAGLRGAIKDEECISTRQGAQRVSKTVCEAQQKHAIAATQVDMWLMCRCKGCVLMMGAEAEQPLQTKTANGLIYRDGDREYPIPPGIPS
jgi:hypothetical protein